ncbi:MAG: amidohydrolase [Candidatus Cryosericum sp.]|nr:amidohydrolase [bacterium]
MVTLLKSARILDAERGTGDGTRVVDILVDGTKIGGISDRIDSREGISIFDASKYLVMPGFVNAHGHLAMTLLRGLADEVALDVWLKQYMFPREALMNGDDVYYGSLLGLAEGIMSGTTTFAEMYFFEDDVARAVEEAGVRANLSIGTSSLDDGLGKLEKSEEFVVRWNNKAEGRIKASFGPHAPYTASPAFVRGNFEHARDLGVIVQVHLHETRKEVEDFVAAYGASPITYYADQGFFDNPPAVLAAHCVHMDARDAHILEDAGASIALNIQSNLKLGSGIPDYRLLLESGVNLCVGTDGAASNDNLDMLEEVRTLGLVMRGSTKDASRISNASLFAMATSNGARALGFDGVGTLTEGAAADLVLWDLDDESLCPGNNAGSHLLWSANSRAVDSVMVAGSWVMEHRELSGIDLEKVRFEVGRRARRLANG